MKLLIIGTLLASNFTLAQVSRHDPIDDRVEITRASIRIGIEDLRNSRPTNSTVEHKDFERALQKFTAKVENELKNYPVDFENEVIGPLKIDLQNYESVKQSTYYSTEEKQILLNDLFLKIQGEAKKRSETFYNSKMPKLFSVVVEHPEDVIMKVSDLDSYTSITTDYGEEALLSRYGGAGRAIYNFLYGEIELDQYTNLLSVRAPELYFISDSLLRTKYSISRGCYSKSCHTLLILAYKKYLNVIDKLGKEFVFQLDTNRLVVFPAYKGDHPSVVKLNLDNSYAYFSDKPMNFSLRSDELDLMDDMVEVAGKARDLEQCKAEMAALTERYCTFGTVNCQSVEAKKLLALEVVEDVLLPEIQLLKSAKEKELIPVAKEYLRIKAKFDRASSNRQIQRALREWEPVRKQKKILENLITRVRGESIKLRQACLQGLD